MIRNTLVAIALAAVCCASSNAAEKASKPSAPAEKIVKAKGSVTLTNAGGMIAESGDEPPLDAVGLTIASDGTSVKVTTTLKDAPGSRAAAPVTIFMDTDLNAATGKKGFAGKPSGFEYALEVALCIEYDDQSVSCAGGSLKSKPASRYGAADLKKYKDDSGNYDTVISSIGFPGEKKAQQYPVDGKIVTASFDYADIGAKSGQTIRLVMEKNGGRFESGAPKFDDVLLTLK